ncbi:unnamed protein product, partial [Closterium sp. NIES-54]
AAAVARCHAHHALLPCPAQRYRAALPRAAPPRATLLPRVLRCCPYCSARRALPCSLRAALLAAHCPARHARPALRTSSAYALPACALPTRTLPTRALPTHALPARALPTRALHARALPTRALPARAPPTCSLPARALPTCALPCCPRPAALQTARRPALQPARCLALLPARCPALQPANRPALQPARCTALQPACPAARAPPCPSDRTLPCPAARAPLCPARCTTLQPVRCPATTATTAAATATTTTVASENLAPLPVMATITVRGRLGGGGYGAGGTGHQRQQHQQETLSLQQLREWVSQRRVPGSAEATSLGACEPSSTGAVSVEALHTFTLDSGATGCFFRDCTTVTPLTTTVPVSLADPSGGLVIARASTVLPCPVDPSGSLTGFHLPSFSKNLVSNAVLQDQFVIVSTPGDELVAISASSRITASCSCRLLSHQTLLWHHRLGHPSLPRLRGMHSRLLVSALPRSLPPLPRSRAPPCLPCVEGRQPAAPHSSLFPPTIAPLQTLHMEVWGPARVRGQVQERYFLLVVEDYTRYTTVFPFRSKADVHGVLIDWIITVCRQLSALFQQDLPVVRLHSDRGGEFSSGLLREFCRVEGIAYSFTLPASPQQKGIAEHRIGLVMEVAHTSMIHASAPHFLWQFAVRYAAHQLNIWPRVSVPETSPTLRWTGEIGDASAFRVWGALSLVRNTTAGKLSPRTLCCVFLGFPTDAPPWQFYHPALCRVLSSQDVTFDESVCFYHLHPHVSTPLSLPPLFLVPGPPPVDPFPPQGPAPLASWFSTSAIFAASAGATGGGDLEGADSGGAGPRVAESRGAGSGGADSGDVGSGGADTGGTASPSGGGVVGAPAGGPGAAGAGGTRARGAGGTGAAGAGGARATGTRGAGAAGAGGARAGGAGGTGAGGTGAAGAGVAGAGGARAGGAGGTGAAGAGGTGAGGTGGARAAGAADKRHELESCPASPVRTVSRAIRSRPPPVPDMHAMALRPSSVPQHVALSSHPASSLPDVRDPESNLARAASPTVTCLLATLTLLLPVVSTASESVCPPSVGGELALNSDFLEDMQFELECLATALPRFASMLLCLEGVPDALDIPTPRSYEETITGPSALRLPVLLAIAHSSVYRPLALSSTFGQVRKSRVVHWDAAKRVLHYLCNTTGMGLVLGGQGPVVLTGHCDASWVDDQATQRSSQGYSLSLSSGSVSWRSTRSSSVLRSTCEAAIYAGALVAQELRWLTYMLADLGERPCSPPVLYVNNKAMIALCQDQRLEHRTKHIALRYFLARELQECGQLRLAFVASRANAADVFTKALGSGDHQCFCTALGLAPTLPHLLVA